MSILKPGNLHWDGRKYIIKPENEVVKESPYVVNSNPSELISILQNRGQSSLTASAVINGGDDIVDPVSLTMVASSKIRISANVGYRLFDGFVAPIVLISIDEGYAYNIYTFSQSMSDGQCSAVFEYNPRADTGQIVKVFFRTRVGDHSINIFTNGVGDVAASLLVEELP